VITDRSCLIMDEVDGMSAGDRGGVGALNALIKKSKVNPRALLDIFRVEIDDGDADSHNMHRK